MFERLKSIFVKENPQEAWDALARHAMYIDYDKAKERAEQRGREEGIEQGIMQGIIQGKAEGVLETQKALTLNVFKRKYPSQDSSFLDKLTLVQYKTVFNMLMDDKSIDEIQSVLQYA